MKYSQRVKGTPEQRFWPKVDKNGPLPDPSTAMITPCWVWTGALSDKGYGHLNVGGGVSQYAHRLSYEWRVGPIADGLVIDHLCRNRQCVNPDHLETVSNMVNTQRQGLRSNNKSGHRGVHWVERCRKWHVQVTAKGKVHNGGYFANLDDAAAAAKNLRRKWHG